jgi:hypothetical protein
VRLAAVVVSLVGLLCGCTAQPGQTSLTLHQQATFSDGTWCRLAEFRMSDKDNMTGRGPARVPGNEVTVSVEISNAGPPISADDVVMRFSYRGDHDQELTTTEVSSETNVVPSGALDRVSKTFAIQDPTEAFRSRYLRVVVEVPSYPSITFSGANP